MDQLILALDVDDAREAVRWVTKFRKQFRSFKVGSQLFTRHGPEIVRELQKEGAELFLDLKWHDIPQTVAHAVKAAADLGVQLATIHASGGSEMMKAALASSKGSGLKLLAVTVLTSFQEADLSQIGVTVQVDAQVLRLARLAIDSGLSGLVCSPHEISLLRSEFKDNPNLTLVTPGVRPAGTDQGDQRRIMTPGEAFRLGASHIVVGRPILQAADPEAMVESILAEARKA